MSARRASSLSPPEVFLLRQWGRTLWESFDEMPYLVGSAERGEAWRDLDVRIILPDKHYFVDGPAMQAAALNVAVSVWGQRATGLPIDFQFQSRTEADLYADGPRNPIGIVVERVQDESAHADSREDTTP